MSRKGLMEQDLSKLDVTKLHPLSPEVISRQATINIGTIGHVAHGKSTVVKAISGVQTVRFKNELERNITIKLGYANAKIYKCEDERCPRPMSFKAYGSGKEDSPLCDVPGFENCRMKLLRHVSFVDCPVGSYVCSATGHDILMATMLNGAAIMDGALLLIAANESCPQPQTSEHLAAVEIMRLQHIIILQNKVDLIQENVAINQHEAIQKFIQGTVADGAPVVPISAQLIYNIDVVCEYIVKKIPIPERNFISPPNMIVIRSFDVNKPGFEVDEIKGGVAGGSILQGVLKVNQFIEVRPGIVVKDENGNIKCTPIYSRIVSLYAEQNELQFAVPGGLIGVGTTMDPTLTRADRLVGQVLGEVGSLPDVFVELEDKGIRKAGKSVKAGQGRDPNVEHRVHVDWGSGHSRKERFGKAATHISCVHQQGREDCTKSTRGEALASNRMGSNSSWNNPRGSTLSALNNHRTDNQNLLKLGTKIVGVGRNYAAHAKELGNAVPKEPVLFLKPTSSYLENGGTIEVPHPLNSLDYEVELAVVIGKTARDVPENTAMNYVGGYAVALDMTAREIQSVAKSAGLPWTVAKGQDTFTPISSVFSVSMVPNPDNLELWLKVDDEIRQKGSTKDMIFKIPYLISHISSIMTLFEGDTILTGTPQGVGPVKVGQKITAGITGLVDVCFDVGKRQKPGST
ncbi:hypothetical protein GOBAR_DD00641 [Gossypium barbadense]|nr:hypothetical protein GOBAR_DD00641 [Gossypium barbadense]